MNKRGVNRRASQNKSPIPTFQSDQVQSITFRYVLTDASADVASILFELPIFPFGLSNSTISLLLPFKAVRLCRLKLVTNYRSSVGMSGNTHSVTYPERRGVRPYEFASTATFMDPAVYEKHFTQDDILGWWYYRTSSEENPEIRVQMTKGSILEMTYAYVLDDADVVQTVSAVGLTAQRVYSNSINTDLTCVGKAFISQWIV